MKNILILGAGTGGTIIANTLAKILPNNDYAITVIDRSDIHIYQPGLLFIPFKLYGYESPADIVKPVYDLLNKSIHFIKADIYRIDHALNTVLTSEGNVDYDWLICSLGCHIAPEELEGCVESIGDEVHTFYTLPYALAFQRALRNMRSGRFVLDIAELPIKCPVAPIEAVFLAEYYFHKRGIRDQIDITLVTPYSGAFTKANANEVLSKTATEKNINIVSNFEVLKIDNEHKEIVAYDGKTIPYDFLCIVPPTMGPNVIADSGLGNDMNYGLTDHRTLKSKKINNIYFLGDNADVPTSKAGSVAHFEAETVINNLLLELDGKTPLPSFGGHANCFIESGYHKAFLVDFNYDVEPLPGKFPLPYAGPFSLLEETYLNHLGKMAFKWVYWNLLVSGRMPEIPFVPAHMSLVGKDLSKTAQIRHSHAGHIFDVMTQDVITISQGSPLTKAAKLMHKHHISGLPVVNTGRELVGIITEADFVCAIDIESESPLDKLIATFIRKGRSQKIGSVVDDIMTPEPITVEAEASLQDAVNLMATHNVNQLIVSDDHKHVAGIVARSDLLRVFG